MEAPNESLVKSRAKVSVDPEELDRQVKMSRNVDVHALQHFLRSLPQHGAKMKELLLQLLQLFNLEDPETATPRTADRFVDSSSLLDKIAPGMGRHGVTAIFTLMMPLLLLMDC